MNKRQYIQNNLQRLRRFEGDTATMFNGEGKDIKAGLGLEYGLTIKNTSNEVIPVALLPGHYRDVIARSLEVTPETVTVADKTTADADVLTGITIGSTAAATASELMSLAGLTCSCVADEFASGDTNGAITVTPHDPSSPVFSFLEYLRTNPMSLRGLQVNASSKAALNALSLVVSSSNPFMRNASKKINISSYFSAHQYQDDMVQIDLNGNELELSDITVLIANIPANSTVNFLLKF